MYGLTCNIVLYAVCMGDIVLYVVCMGGYSTVCCVYGGI